MPGYEGVDKGSEVALLVNNLGGTTRARPRPLPIPRAACRWGFRPSPLEPSLAISVLFPLGTARALIPLLRAAPATAMELAVATRSAVKALQRRGIAAARVFAGPFVTALDMSGLSVSLMALSGPVVARCGWYSHLQRNCESPVVRRRA